MKETNKEISQVLMMTGKLNPYRLSMVFGNEERYTIVSIGRKPIFSIVKGSLIAAREMAEIILHDMDEDYFDLEDDSHNYSCKYCGGTLTEEQGHLACDTCDLTGIFPDEEDCLSYFKMIPFNGACSACESSKTIKFDNGDTYCRSCGNEWKEN